MINKKNISYTLILASFLFIIEFNFVSLFFSMVLVFLLIKKLNLFFINYSDKFKFHKFTTKIISIFIISFLMILILIGLNQSFIFFKDNYQMILEKFNNLILDLAIFLPFDIKKFISFDKSFSETIINLIKNQHENIFYLTIDTFKFISNCFIGIFLGVLLSFYYIDNKIKINENLSELSKRVNNFLYIFESVFLGQGKISLINTVFTGLYLYGFLALSGYYIPYSEYLIFLTFIFGLLPIIGNLISNTLIILFSFTIGFKIVIFSIIFLIVVHKIEYYINGLILGKKINLNLFETILSMIIFEGMFLGTLIYGYIKIELKELNLI